MNKVLRISKIVIGVAMYVVFLLLMGQHLIYGSDHEWLGLTLFVLFFVHTALNYRWYLALFKGKYTPVRILQTAVDVLLLAAMILCIYSSMKISGTVFEWMDLSGTALGRKLHLITTAWSFVLMSCHVGLHWSSVVALGRKIRMPAKAKNVVTWILRVLVIAVSAFGVYIFIGRKFYEEMFLLTMYKWYNYNTHVFPYLIQSAAMSAVFIALFYYVKKAMLSLFAKKPRCRAGEQATDPSVPQETGSPAKDEENA